MTYRIIFPNDSEGISVIIPVPGVSPEEATKAVPSGKPYLIIDVSGVPTDRTFREAWTADFTDAPIKG